jgi:hypothetical protein
MILLFFWKKLRGFDDFINLSVNKPMEKKEVKKKK